MDRMGGPTGIAQALQARQNLKRVLPQGSTMFGATDGNVGLNVYHGSTDAPSVDVLADGSVLVSDLMYGEFSGFVEVAAADYTIGIAPTGGTSIADFTAPLSGLGGESAVVFASGFLTPGDSDPGFGLFAALEDGSVLELSTYVDSSKTEPSSSAANNPKPGSLSPGVKKPDANTTALSPPKPLNGAVKSAMEVPPVGAIPIV